MFLRRGVGEGLEPVGKVRCTSVHGPDTDGVGQGIGGCLVQRPLAALLLHKGSVHGLWELCGQLLQAEDVCAVDFRAVRIAVSFLWPFDGTSQSVHVLLQCIDSGGAAAFNHLCFFVVVVLLADI